MRFGGGVVTALIAAGLVLAGSASATAAGTIEPDGPTSVEVRVVGPGHEAAWEMSVRNASGGAVGPVLTIAEVSGSVFEGAHPAAIELTRGTERLYAGPAKDLVHRSFELGSVAVGERAGVEAVVRLPSDAGDEYRTATGIVRWEFAALGAEPPPGTSPPGATPEPPSRIPVTGSGSASFGIASTALLALTVGSVLILHGRRSRGLRGRVGGERS